MTDHITCIIATYKRVDALKCTLQALQLQQHENWTALVIGDCCGDETADMLRDWLNQESNITIFLRATVNNRARIVLVFS